MYNILLKLSLCVATLVASMGVSMADENFDIDQHRKNRGLVEMDNVFVPKGQWIVGATGSYSTHTNDDYNLLIVEDIVSDGYNVKVSPILAYAVKNNLTLGARFEYSRSLIRVDNSKLSIGDEESSVDITVNDIYSISQSFLGKATVRQYIPIGHTKRFSLFSEAQFGLGGGRSKYAFDSPVQGTYCKSFELSVNMMPGVVAFATDLIAFEVTVGTLGLSFTHDKLIQNQVYTGSVNSSNMSFTVNLFSISLGVAVYL